MKDIQIAEIKLTDSEINAALEVLKSGSLRQGAQCADFEQEFAEEVGAKFAVTAANGSATLHLAYLSFLKPGDEVLVPSFTFIATAGMVIAAGGVPIFCDVDPNTFNIALDDAEKKITSKTAAISPVHLFGNSCDIDSITSFSKKHNLKVVHDAAQAHGTEYNDKGLGHYSDFVSYSFYPSKNMFVGEGGIICTNDGKAAEYMRFAKSHGQTGKYLHTQLGLNYRMTDVEAAIGREQLKRLDQMIEIRSRNAEIIRSGLVDVPGLKFQEITPNSKHAWHQLCFLVESDSFGVDRDSLAGKLQEKKIATGVHYPRGLHQQPVFIDMYGVQNLPVTEQLSRDILAIPVHHGLSTDDANYIVEAIASIFQTN